MGLIVPQTIKVRTGGKAYRYYKEKGYEFEKCGDIIEVDVIDLYPGSHEKVKIICDICGNESEIEYRHFIKSRKKGILVSCASDSCIKRKREDTCTKRYGVKYVVQSEEVKEKIKDTNLERHGAENPFGSKEIQDKIKGTWQKNYGENITNPSQVQEIKDKIRATWQENHGKYITSPFQLESVREKSKQTWQKNYGVNNPMKNTAIQNKAKATCQEKYGGNAPTCSEEIQNKVKATNLERHGVEYPTQNEEIKNKALDSYQFNGTGPCSRAQRYVNYILNGTLNKRICGSLVDIYMEKENIVIEYDGHGHFLRDMINGNKTPTKKSLLYEKEREDKIINNGYRMIRFIATKDRIPSDEVILNLIEGFKSSDFKVIRINFEEGTIEKDYEEKSHHDFGKLRKITQKDLEKFEKQEENTSEN